MKAKTTQEEIKKTFQPWLDKFNNRSHQALIDYRGFIPPDERSGFPRAGQNQCPNGLIPFPIQQVEDEIFGLVDVLLKELESFDNVLEIGLGNFGGTHALWRCIFKNVTTIEQGGSLINRIKQNNPEFNDGKSNIIHGSSFDEGNLNKIPKEIDFLFIDGDHNYGAVAADFNIYRQIVKKNGIIAFHDSKQQNFGVYQFVKNLKNDFSETGIEVKDIWLSNDIGISYFKT